MSTTSMPFLYQTRTILRLNGATNRSVLPSLAHSAGLHSSSCRAAWQPRNNNPRRGGYIPAHKREGFKDHIPFELPPDVELPKDENIEVAEPSEPVDTITPRERRAFKNIFMEIANRGEPPLMPTGVVENSPSQFLASLAAKQKGKDNRETSINVIMQDAAEAAKQAQPAGIPGLDPLSPLESMYSAADRQEALLKFPPSLRQAARVAYGVMGGDAAATIRVEDGQREQMATAVPDQISSREDPVDIVGMEAHQDLVRKLKMETARRSERLRIRSLMVASQTDAELWTVMETEVFALVKRLGLESDIELSMPKTKRGKKAQGPEQGSSGQHKPLNPETYGPIYPMLLFEGVHLLNTKFLRPSPYMFHVLPRVKDLGLMSYVLGVSTSFYNQLMAIVWERYGDAAGVLNLMEEMRHAGLYFDQQSQRILRNIAAVYEGADQGDQGPFLKKLMGMPEFEPFLLHRLNHWQKAVTLSIAHQMKALA